MSFVDVQFVGCGDAFGTGGRFNTCFHVCTPKQSFLIDCGATSLVALKKFSINPNSIDAIFLTHLHGDHFTGVIFFLMDARYVSKRTRPLVIAGPKEVKARIFQTMELLYPGCWDKGNEFDLIFIELTKGHRQGFNGIGVFPYSAQHLQDGNDFILRFDVYGKTITYSGDTGWTDDLILAAQDVDLFICESSTFDEELPFHLDYLTIQKKLPEINAKRVILTHLGPDALARQDQMRQQVAFDGMKISL
jgi:ribonuclease BN (tRNA processing enzyme)